jgi:phage terminase small subunit
MLTDKQKLFAKFFVELNHITDAAIKAGYSKDSAASQGSKLLKLAKIKTYILFLQSSVEDIFKDEVKRSLEVLIELRDDKRTPHTVRLKASIEILDRAGYGATQKIAGKFDVSHNGNITTTESKEVHIIQQIVNTNEELADAILSAMRNQPVIVPTDDKE